MNFEQPEEYEKEEDSESFGTEKETKEKIEAIKSRITSMLKERPVLFKLFGSIGKEQDELCLINNEALINQVCQENFYGVSDISGEYDGEYIEKISQSIDSYLVTLINTDIETLNFNEEIKDFLRKQKEEAVEIYEMLRQISLTDKNFLFDHHKITRRNPKFEKTPEFCRAYSYLKSKYRYGGYVNSQEKLNKIEEDIKNGNYSEILKEYENKKGREFEKTLQFRQVWDYLVEKYPFQDGKTLAELRGQDNVDARRKNDIRNDLEALRDLGYYEELMAFYHKNQREE